MNNGDKPIANPFVVLREEFDDWAVLFNPDTGRGFGLNPTAVHVWKLLDGEHSISDMLKTLHRDTLDVPEDAGEQLCAFVDALTHHGLAASEIEQVQEYRVQRQPCPACTAENLPDAMKFVYQAPRLVNLSGDVRADGTCYLCSDGSTATSGCTQGASATWGCVYGNSAPHTGQSCVSGATLTTCQAGIYAACDCISYGAFAGGQCSNGTGTYH